MRALSASLTDADRAAAGAASDRAGLPAAGAEILVKRLVGELAQIEWGTVDLERRLDEQGVDSLNLIVLRERIQEAFGAVFSDDEWVRLDTPASLLGRLAYGAAVPASSARPNPTTAEPGPITAREIPSGDVLEIGMPLTGRNNLAETPLLQYLGDRRWRQLSEMIGVPTRLIVDEQGERLYATFFYVEVAFPPERPMAAFGENDRFRVVSTIARYGTSMVDGIAYLFPEEPGAARDGRAADRPFSSIREANAAGVPAVRLSNIFVRQFGGAEWLKKGRPAHARFADIPALSEPPDSYLLTKQAEQDGRFDLAGAGWFPMTAGPVERDYRLIPDRDLNGAGLVYFANYPMFLDICERDVLLTAPQPLSETLVDRRTVVRRQIAYLNNASSSDTLRIEIEPWIRTTPAPRAPGRGDLDVQLHVNYRMFRRSDNRLMMVSTVRKVIPDASASDVPGQVKA